MINVDECPNVGQSMPATIRGNSQGILPTIFRVLHAGHFDSKELVRLQLLQQTLQ